MKDNEVSTTDYQTPCYIVHKERLYQNIIAFKNAFLLEWGSNFAMGYSIKTNHLPWLLQYAKAEGFFAEAVSDDEFRLALSCGFEPREIIFNGPQKGRGMLESALDGGSIVNLDNFEEIELISEYLKNETTSNQDQNSLRIGLRVNFDLEELCPGETTAGNNVSRFGFCVENGELQRAIEVLHQMGLKIQGFHMHYSTLSRSSSVFAWLAKMACEAACKYGIKEEIKFIDIGGGFWGGSVSTRYPSPEQYAKQITSILCKTFDPKQVQLIIEPGASILATAIDYRCHVISVKQIRDTRVVTTNGTFLHINPFQVKRQPSYTVCRVHENKMLCKQVVCGNTCIENDRFFQTENEFAFSVGDEIIFQAAGAYTVGLNSCFIHSPPEVYLSDKNGFQKEITCIRRRQRGLMEIC